MTQYTEYLYKCPACKESFMASADNRGLIDCPYCSTVFIAKDQLVEGGE